MLGIIYVFVDRSLISTCHYEHQIVFNEIEFSIGISCGEAAAVDKRPRLVVQTVGYESGIRPSQSWVHFGQYSYDSLGWFPDSAGIIRPQ